MTTNTNAALIAWLRREQDVDDPLGLEFTPEEIASALEAAEQRAEQTERERTFYQRELHTSDDIARRARQRGDVQSQRAEDAVAERDALAAVVEKVRMLTADPGGFTYKDFDRIASAAPADLLREVKAEAWDEGNWARRMYVENRRAGRNVTMPANPYRGEEQP